MKKDIVCIMSDQHNGFYTSMNPEMEDITPNIKRIAETGCWVEQAYCNAPLCVPSRMSFLTGKQPAQNRIMNNDTTLNVDEVTLAHEIGLEGYETILVGRMHFKGLDQFHGFDRRYIGDITNQYWGMTRDEIKEFHKSFGSKHCQTLIGAGESPILDFDQRVFEKAKELLQTPHTKPIFMVVGFYSPHYPYISKEETIRVTSSVQEEQMAYPWETCYQDCRQDTTKERVAFINQAYKRMIYTIDGYVGKLYDAFHQAGDGLFVYTSDHGDQLGKRSIFGKRTLYEDAIRIPMLLHGVNTELHHPIDLISLHDMLLSYAKNGNIELAEKPIIVQSILGKKDHLIWCEAVILNQYKLVFLNGTKHLYNIVQDVQEQHDLSMELPDMLRTLSTYLSKEHEVRQYLAYEQKRQDIIETLNAHGKAKHMSYQSDFQVQDLFIPKPHYEYRKEDIQCDNQ